MLAWVDYELSVLLSRGGMCKMRPFDSWALGSKRARYNPTTSASTTTTTPSPWTPNIISHGDVTMVNLPIYRTILLDQHCCICLFELRNVYRTIRVLYFPRSGIVSQEVRQFGQRQIRKAIWTFLSIDWQDLGGGSSQVLIFGCQDEHAPGYNCVTFETLHT